MGIKWGTTSATYILSESLRIGRVEFLCNISIEFGVLIKLVGLIKIFLDKTSCKCVIVKNLSDNISYSESSEKKRRCYMRIAF